MNIVGVRQRERKGERKSLTDIKGVGEKEREQKGEGREGEGEGREGEREGREGEREGKEGEGEGREGEVEVREGKTWILTWYLDRRDKVREGQEGGRRRDRVSK
jgi:hypothetical protein